jgi:hypothetical protein
MSAPTSSRAAAPLWLRALGLLSLVAIGGGLAYGVAIALANLGSIGV